MFKRTLLLLLALGFSGAALANDSVIDAITVETLSLFAPRASADVLNSILVNKSYLEDAEINSPTRLYLFFAHVATETGGLSQLEESLNYSETSLLRVFGKRISRDEAKYLAGNPREIANRLYSNRLGNRDPGSNDGWRYRGSGFVGITGRANFRSVAALTGLPLEEHPEIARRPKEAFEIATLYWAKHNLNFTADTGSIVDVRRKLVGGNAGLDVYKIWATRAERVFGRKLAELGVSSAVATDKLQSEEESNIAEILLDKGYVRRYQLDSENREVIVKNAISEFLRDNALSNSTGAIDVDYDGDLMVNDFLKGAQESQKTLTNAE